MADVTINLPKSEYDSLLSMRVQNDAKISALQKENQRSALELRDKAAEVQHLKFELQKVENFMRAFRELTVVADNKKGK